MATVAITARLGSLRLLGDSLWRGSAEPRPAARQASNAEALLTLAEATLGHEG